MMKFLAIFFLTISFNLLNVYSQGIATYEDIRNLPNQPEILLIDVREIDEIERTGLIPTSIVIPGELNYFIIFLLFSNYSNFFFKNHRDYSQTIEISF